MCRAMARRNPFPLESLMTITPRPVGDMRAVQLSLNCCRTSIYKLMREDPDFPAPFQVLDKLTWFLDEIEEFKATRPRRRYADSAA